MSEHPSKDSGYHVLKQLFTKLKIERGKLKRGNGDEKVISKLEREISRVRIELEFKKFMRGISIVQST